MRDIWSILGIPPTQDQEEIKRAYAEQSKLCHPEENPQAFMELRDAYRAALDAARNGKTEASQAAQIQPAQQAEGIENLEDALAEESSQEVQFTFSPRTSGAENPFWESPAFQQFVKLYRKENRKNWKLWMEYFVSPEFLLVRREEEFWGLVLDHVKSKEEEGKPGAAFVSGVYISCHIREIPTTAKERHFTYQGGPCPEILASLLRILPSCGRMSAEEDALYRAFGTYDTLWSMAQTGIWDDESFRKLRKSLSVYHVTNIAERISGRPVSAPTEELNQHPLSLRLIADFLARAELPEEAYRIAWETLDLKSALFGRAAVLHGPLRKICLEHCPQLEHQERERFMEVRSAYMKLTKEPAALDAFFAREDVQRALLNRDFIEGEVMHFWVNSARNSPLMFQRLQTFYEAHPEAPFSQKLQEGCVQALQEFEKNQRDSQDAQDTSLEISLCHRPFLRYWFSVAFPRFGALAALTKELLPASPTWIAALFEDHYLEEGQAVEPILVEFDEVTIQIQLHQFYLSYQINDQAILFPGISIDELWELGEVGLWLLPLAEVRSGEKEAVRAGVAALLQESALPEEDVPAVTNALVDGLYQWNLEGAASPILMFQETDRELYGAEITPERIYQDQDWDDFEEEDEDLEDFEEEEGLEGFQVHLFRVVDGTPRYLPDSFGPFESLDEAVDQADTLLQQTVAPPVLAYAPLGEHENRRLPVLVSDQPHHRPVRNWELPAEVLNRLWNALHFWAELRVIPQRLEEHIGDLENHWKLWSQENGRKRSVVDQMNVLCAYFAEEVADPEELTGPESPAYHLDQLRTLLEAMDLNALSEEEVLQTLLDAPGWADWEPFPNTSIIQERPEEQTSKGISEDAQHLLEEIKRARGEKAQEEREQLDSLRAAFLERLDPLLSCLHDQVKRLRKLEVDKLDQKLEEFFQGKLDRLELSYVPPVWKFSPPAGTYPPQYSLVFLRVGMRFACLLFDDVRQFFYALHCPNRNGSNEIEIETLIGLSHEKPLPASCLFPSLFQFQRHLSAILDVVVHAQQAQKNFQPPAAGPCLWVKSWGNVYVGNRESKYNLAKRELGRFPENRASTSLEADVSLPSSAMDLHQPIDLCWQEVGQEKTAPIELQENQRYLFPKMIKRFFDGELTQLRLGWKVLLVPYRNRYSSEYYQKKLEALDGRPPRCYLELRRDGDKMMLLLLEEFTQKALYHVADHWTYMDVEGKKYPKDTFDGKSVPAYLVHHNPLQLRNHLDLLMEHLDFPCVITDRFAEYAEEKPVKARAYEVIRAEVLGEP